MEATRGVHDRSISDDAGTGKLRWEWCFSLPLPLFNRWHSVSGICDPGNQTRGAQLCCGLGIHAHVAHQSNQTGLLFFSIQHHHPPLLPRPQPQPQPLEYNPSILQPAIYPVGILLPTFLPHITCLLQTWPVSEEPALALPLPPRNTRDDLAKGSSSYRGGGGCCDSLAVGCHLYGACMHDTYPACRGHNNRVCYRGKKKIRYGYKVPASIGPIA